MMLLFVHVDAWAQQAAFALHDGDRVVFFGDSISAQRFYTTYLQTAVRARFPEWNIRFYNAGVGGDNVHGGIAGKIDARIDRDILKFQPTVVTIMLGMNDRSHAAEYEAGYEHILQHLRAASPDLRITVLGPTPVDGTTNNNPSANTELRRFLEVDKRLADMYGARFIDLQAPVLAALERAEKLNHLAALSLIPDRIHPQPPIHMLMAETILAGWNYPKTTSKIVIDAATNRVLRQDGAVVSNVVKNKSAVEWTALETADEIRFVTTDGNEVLYQDMIGAEHVGSKLLQVTSLAKGRYSLFIDGKPLMETWSEKELETGIHLDRLATPAHRAGVAVYYACYDSELNQTEHSRLVGTLEAQHPEMISKLDAVLQAAAERSESLIQAATKRVERHYSLVALP
ncbi:SGNH/GDSL hydrolase family protein [Terriglobus tenax]|uniref:SGNH/GDSL hydrolase family protein n=1 Tax=Terriglobus tenax TaxID=1111115 RepID=UPI0021E00198|nr:SGNH/GDSL hydrolase family protein [Terriglobus tenax]